MDFEPFAPIDLPGSGEKEENPVKRLREEIERLKRENLELKRQLEKEKFSRQSERVRYEEEKRRLLEKIEALQGQNVQLQNLVNNLEAELKRLQSELELVKNLAQNLETKLEKALQEQRRKILEIALRVLTETLKKILLMEKIQDEEILKGVFKELFSEKFFTGELTVRVNPQDIPLIEEVLKDKKKTTVEFIPDPNLQRGEVEVETEKFSVERKYDQLVEEFVTELLQKYTQEEPQT
jgi:flagellar biosynthesis/type III secretory pathway protein FliH